MNFTVATGAGGDSSTWWPRQLGEQRVGRPAPKLVCGFPFQRPRTVRTTTATRSARPLFDKCNTVNRGGALNLQGQQPQFMMDQFNQKCVGNRYPTTIQAGQLLQERVVGRKHPGMLMTSNKLVEGAALHSEDEEAAAVLGGVPADAEEVLGSRYPQTLVTWPWLGDAPRVLEGDADAEGYLRRAYEAMESLSLRGGVRSTRASGVPSSCCCAVVIEGPRAGPTRGP